MLHLIEPLGFRLTGKELRRAGMDYWEQLDVRRYMNFEEFAQKNLAEHPAGKALAGDNQGKKGVHAGTVWRRGLSHVRKGERRDSRGTPRRI